MDCAKYDGRMLEGLCGLATVFLGWDNGQGGADAFKEGGGWFGVGVLGGGNAE